MTRSFARKLRTLKSTTFLKTKRHFLESESICNERRLILEAEIPTKREKQFSYICFYIYSVTLEFSNYKNIYKITTIIYELLVYFLISESQLIFKIIVRLNSLRAYLDAKPMC